MIYFPQEVFNIIRDFSSPIDFPFNDPIKLKHISNKKKTLTLMLNTMEQIHHKNIFYGEQPRIIPSQIGFYQSGYKSLYLYFGYISQR